MKYLKYTYVDINTRVSVIEQPATNGPDFPTIKGLKFVFALESLWPTDSPIFLGTADDTANINISGVLGELTKVEFDATQTAEMADRAAIVRDRRMTAIPAERYKQEVSGLLWNGVFIDTDERSQPKIKAARDAAREGMRIEDSIWKCGNPLTGEELYRPTTNAEMIEIGALVFTHVQSCYDRESILINMVIAGTYTDDMLTTGWPHRGTIQNIKE